MDDRLAQVHPRVEACALTRYRTIVADPPWDYEEFVSINRTPGKWSRRVTKSLPYPSMTVDEIRGLPVSELCASDGCHLFLWTTNRYLPASFDVLQSWGFDYRQTLVWHKVNGTPFASSVAPNHAEFLLYARRGSVPLLDRLRTNVVSIRHNAKTHSKKPEAFLDLIETVSPEPRLEMFARRQRLGWHTWGNQALEHVELAS